MGFRQRIDYPFGASTLGSSYTSGAGSVVLASGGGSAFFGSVTPTAANPVRFTISSAATPSNCTHYECTGVSTDTLTGVTLLAGTDRNYAIGDNIFSSIYAEDFSDIQSATTGALAPTGVKTSGYSAAAGDLVLCNCSGGSLTVTLPTAPPDKSKVQVVLSVAASIPNNTAVVTIAAGGSDTIGGTGATSTMVCSAGDSILVQYDSSLTQWLVIEHRCKPFVQVFTSSATWAKPPWANRVDVYGVGSGGGGAAGPVVASGTATGGGGGASGGAAVQATFAATDLPATVSVTLGAGGTGAVSGGAASTNGTASSFGTYCSAAGGKFAASTVGASSVSGLFSGGAGGSGSSGAAGGAPSNVNNPQLAGQGGAAGGGISTTPGAFAGGATGGLNSVNVLSSGTAGTSGGGNGGNGASATPATYAPYPAQGGGGGGSSITGNGGNGGNGGSYGGGGGGGGAAISGNGVGGTGGNGGPGILVVISS